MIKLLFTTHSFHKDVLEACSDELVDSLDEFTKTWLRQVALYIPKTEAKILHGLDSALTAMLATASARRKKALVRLLDTIAPALSANPVAVAPAPQAPAPVTRPSGWTEKDGFDPCAKDVVDPLAPLPDEVDEAVITQENLVDAQQVMQDEFLQALDGKTPTPEVAAGFAAPPIVLDTAETASTTKKFVQKKKKKPEQAYKPKLVIPKIRAQNLLANLYNEIKKEAQ